MLYMSLSNALFLFNLVMYNFHLLSNVIAWFCQYYIELIRGSCATGMLLFAVLLVTIMHVFVRIYFCIGLKAYALALKGNFYGNDCNKGGCAILHFFIVLLFYLIYFSIFPFSSFSFSSILNIQCSYAMSLLMFLTCVASLSLP